MSEVSIEVTLLCLFGSLAIVTVFALYSSWQSLDETKCSDNYISARGTQSSAALGWSFFASGMGSWTIFSFPEIGVYKGIWGLIGYTLSMCLPLLLLAYFGPLVRERMKKGVTWSGYITEEYGRVLQIYVFCISVLFQFITIVAEFSGVGFLVQTISPETSSLWPIISIAVATTIYTTFGGLQASISTDIWEGVAVIGLVFSVFIGIFVHYDIPDNWTQSSAVEFNVEGFEALVTLCLAVTSANLFLTGFWQRVWAAQSDRQLQRGCLFACALTVPFSFILIGTGMIFKILQDGPSGFEGDAYNPLFSLLNGMGNVWQVITLFLIVLLVASSVDTIENGIAAEFLSLFKSKVSLNHARILTALLNIPSVLFALEEINVLQLFLIADLFTTATVGPMLLAHWKRAHPIGAFLGCLSGLLAIFVQGLFLYDFSIRGAFSHFMLNDNIYARSTMFAFIIAAIVPVIVTISVSFLLPQKARKPNRSSLSP